MATVYHAIHPTFGIIGHRQFPKEYKKVAEVQSVDVDEVYRLTNHIDGDWQKNKLVMPVGSKNRSTSMGDVIEIKGVYYRCNAVGWEIIKPNI